MTITLDGCVLWAHSTVVWFFCHCVKHFWRCKLSSAWKNDKLIASWNSPVKVYHTVLNHTQRCVWDPLLLTHTHTHRGRETHTHRERERHTHRERERETLCESVTVCPHHLCKQVWWGFGMQPKDRCPTEVLSTALRGQLLEQSWLIMSNQISASFFIID
jgi:hypothetical protein